MKSRKWLAVLAVLCMVLTMVPAFTLSSVAETVDGLTCPAMPKGATNYATADKMVTVGQSTAYYNNDTLLMVKRDGPHVTHGNAVVKVELDPTLTVADGYVISYWSKLATDSTAFHAVRFLADGDGNYYELLLYADKALLSQNGGTTLATYTVPSTGKVMADAAPNTISGNYKRIEIYVRPTGTTGSVDASFFVNGEAMTDASGNNTVTLAGTTPALCFGNRAVDMTARAVRLYKADAAATEFEPTTDPQAEITAAADGVSGENGGTGLPTNPSASIPTYTVDDLLVPVMEGDEDLSAYENCPQMPLGGINYALGAASTVKNNGTNVYDADNGYVNLQTANWATPSVDLSIIGINPDDDYVISFFLNRPYSWAQTSNYVLTFGTDGTRVQQLSMNINGTTYTAADGSTKALAAITSSLGKWNSPGVKVEIHCYPDGQGTRNIDIYGDGNLIAHVTKQAILPIEFQATSAYTNTSFTQKTMGLRIYKVNPDATAFAPEATATQEQAVKNPSSGNASDLPTNLIADNETAKKVNASPAYTGTTIDLSNVLTTSDSYVLSAYLRVHTAAWSNTGIMRVGQMTKDADNKSIYDAYELMLRHPSENSGRGNLNYTGVSGYGSYQFFPDNGSTKLVAGQFYKVDAFVTPSATEGSVDIYFYIDGVKITKYNWSDGAGSKGGKLTVPAFTPAVGVSGYCSGLYVYKVSGTTYEPCNYRPSGAADTTPPVISGIQDGDWYDTDRYFTVTDTDEFGFDNLKSVTINGEVVESIGYNTYLLPTGQAHGGFDVVATDNAGNQTKLTVISNVVVYHTLKISYTNMGYRIYGITEGDGELYNTARSFTVQGGSTVRIVPERTETTYGTIKNASWGWLADNAYTIDSFNADTTYVIQGFSNPKGTLTIEGQGTVDGFPTSGYVYRYHEYTVTATPAAGWEFSHFVWGGQEKTANPFTLVTGKDACELVAVFVEAEDTRPTYTVTLPETVGGTAIGGATVSYGDTVTLTATAADGYEFAYWMIGNRTYADSTLTWTVNADVTATPVFRALDAEEHTVIFRSADGRVIATMTSSEIDGGAALPEVPTRYGYTNGAWDFEPADGITADLSVYPTYTKDATQYTVTAVGGTVSKGQAEYETRVKATATIDGFTAWVDENGNVLSTDAEYVFFVTRNVTVTAVSDKTADYGITINPTSLNTSTSATQYTITLIGETMFADGYRLIECGFVYTTKDLDEDALVMGAENVKKVVSSKRNAGQFAYTLKGAPKTATVTARAYMVIEKDGVQTAVYSGLCDASWN